MRKTQLQRYAKLIARTGLNVKKGQTVFINAGLDPDDPTGTYYRPMSLLSGELNNWMEHMTKLGTVQE